MLAEKPGIVRANIVYIRNNTGSAIPNKSLVRVEDYNETNLYFQGTKPNEENLSEHKLANVVEAIAAGDIGVGYVNGIYVARLASSSSSVSVGDNVGTKNSSYEVTKIDEGNFGVLSVHGSTLLLKSIGGGGSGSVAFYKITQSLEYASAGGSPPEGVDTYKGVPYDLSPWTSDDEEILYGIAMENGGYSTTDLRFWGRWYAVGDVVPVVTREETKYIQATFIPLTEGDAVTGVQVGSLRWNEDEQRLMAVFR